MMTDPTDTDQGKGKPTPPKSRCRYFYWGYACADPEKGYIEHSIYEAALRIWKREQRKLAKDKGASRLGLRPCLQRRL